MKNFYSKLAPVYDQMTRFHERLDSTASQLDAWVQQHSIKTALDVGCGTGLIACALASLGVKTTGLDNNREMLDRARVHSENMSLDIEWQLASMLEINSIEQTFDAVFSLGNTMPHLESSSQLNEHFHQVYDKLGKSGVFIFQLVNFERLEKKNQRILNIRKSDDVEMIRFYDFSPDRVGFNILTIDWKETPPQHDLNTTFLSPFSRQVLEEAAERVGFKELQIYANLARDPWTSDSHDIVGVARKS